MIIQRMGSGDGYIIELSSSIAGVGLIKVLYITRKLFMLAIQRMKALACYWSSAHKHFNISGLH